MLAETSGKRVVRTSIIAGLIGSQPVAPLYFQGYCDTQVVLTWLNKELLPRLTAGMTLIFDNASFHKSAEIRGAIEAAGCQLLFLPPYSPDLNPIEQYWAKLKAAIRRLKTGVMTLEEALCQVFKQTDH